MKRRIRFEPTAACRQRFGVRQSSVVVGVGRTAASDNHDCHLGFMVEDKLRGLFSRLQMPCHANHGRCFIVDCAL